jgi:2-oxoglutarate ferredoxin oxidoreductase subunit alpha
MFEISLRIGGEAGDGALTAGNIIAKIFSRYGLYVSTYKDFPSQIRGIHTNYTIRASSLKRFSRPSKIDFLFAFDEKSIIFHQHEIKENGILIAEEKILGDTKLRKDLKIFKIPFLQITLKEFKKEIYKNSILLGVFSCFVEIDEENFINVLEETYGRKGKEVLEKNLLAFKIGRNFVNENFKDIEKIKFPEKKENDNILISGNEICAISAIYSGCRFFSGYPITPATEILEFLSKFMPKFGGVILQVEDEIAAINAAVGAGIAGIRAMTATSGPGFSLMTEGISYAGMTETPVVIVDSQRAGPSTGMPTKFEQSDLFHAVFGGHGDFPRCVLAPSHPEEIFEFTNLSFNIAEKYQIPVILLLDQFLSQNLFTIKIPEIEKFKIERGEFLQEPQREYKRFSFNENGISKRTYLGMDETIFHITGVEHDEEGHITTYAPLRKKMNEKRFLKIENLKREMPEEIVLGDGENVIVTWGSTRLAVEEIIDDFKNLKIVIVRGIYPLRENLKEILKGKKIICVEQNLQGQFSFLIEKLIKREVIKILKYSGRPFHPEELKEKIGRALYE